MIDLYVICAGKGSRLASGIPKALYPIVDHPCLTTTLQQIGHKFSNVFIVTNNAVQNVWDDYFKGLKTEFPELYKNITNIPIDSGLGDGHAVLQAFKRAPGTAKVKNSVAMSNDVIIAWGDVFFPQAEIIDEMISCPISSSDVGVLPVVRENTPYVSLLVNEKMYCTGADFSKYGENHPTGLHDQSVFRFKKDTLWGALSALHMAFWKNGRYITPGGELSLLYSFHMLYNNGIPAKVYETSYPTLSFNTTDEVKLIQEEINEKWIHKFRPNLPQY